MVFDVQIRGSTTKKITETTRPNVPIPASAQHQDTTDSISRNLTAEYFVSACCDSRSLTRQMDGGTEKRTERIDHARQGQTESIVPFITEGDQSKPGTMSRGKKPRGRYPRPENSVMGRQLDKNCTTIITRHDRARGTNYDRMSLSGRLRHEHHGLVAIDQNGACEVPAHRPREHQSLQVSAFADHVRHGIAVADASNVLLD